MSGNGLIQGNALRTARAAQGDKRAKVSSTTGSGRHGGANEKVVETVTVERYWPSKAPKWAAGDDDDEKGDHEKHNHFQSGKTSCVPVSTLPERKN